MVDEPLTAATAVVDVLAEGESGIGREVTVAGWARRLQEGGKGKVATEQGYIGELLDGTKNDMHNCNFFDFNEDGKFQRVIIWMAGTSPLV